MTFAIDDDHKSDRGTLGDRTADCAALAARIGDRAERAGRTVAVAESLTGGRVASELAAAPHASSWFRGGVVAYANEVKYGVLRVPVGPVISATCAQAMAEGVVQLTAADYAVAVTGVGGPDEQEGQPVGTVFIAVVGPAGNRVERYQLSGEPEVIVAEAATHALLLLDQRVGQDG